MIEFSQLEEMFTNMRENSGWNVDGPLLWGYFFTDHSPEKLDAFIPHLLDEGYRYVGIYMPDLDEGEDEYYFLHVEKEETHTPESLHQRNLYFYSLAEQLQLDSYDGMDVGPIKTP